MSELSPHDQRSRDEKLSVALLGASTPTGASSRRTLSTRDRFLFSPSAESLIHSTLGGTNNATLAVSEGRSQASESVSECTTGEHLDDGQIYESMKMDGMLIQVNNDDNNGARRQFQQLLFAGVPPPSSNTPMVFPPVAAEAEAPPPVSPIVAEAREEMKGSSFSAPRGSGKKGGGNVVIVKDDTANPSLLNDVLTGYVTRSTIEDLEILNDSGFGGENIEHLCASLRVNPNRGLDPDPNPDWEWRQRTYGTNQMPSKQRTPFWRLIYDASADFMLRILMVAAVVSLVLSIAFGDKPEIEWIEGAAILLAVVIVILVTAVNDWMKEKQFAQLYAQEEKHCSVIRGGEIQNINTKDLLVGDIVSVETGDEIPADSLILKGQDLSVDESSLTGEADLISKEPIGVCNELVKQKHDEILEAKEQIRLQQPTSGKTHHIVPSPVCLSGSVVSSGSGKLLVIAIGVRSQVGKLFTKLTVDTEPTPLQNKLNALARDVGNMGLCAAVLTLVVLIVEYWILYAFLPADQLPDGSDIAQEMVNFLVISITIVVVAVPEGLPLAVTISLAFSVNKMLEDQNYVRRLAACETMGGANEICSDKTGTLTKNQMEVEAYWNGSGLAMELDFADEHQFLPKSYMDVFAANVSANSTGYTEKSFVDIGGGNQKQIVKQVGSPTECALLQFVENLGYDYRSIRKFYMGGESDKGADGEQTKEVDKIIMRVPFSSDRKFMSTIVRHPDGNGLFRIFVKGAAEVVLRRCEQRLGSGQDLKQLNAQRIENIENAVVHKLAMQALRAICVAYKDFDPEKFTDWQQPESPGSLFYKCESGLVCLGITGIRDPVREEVPSAVRTCQEAGIRVRMCTGDNIETAKQIALKCNIYRPECGGIAMLGPEFSKLVGGVVCAKCRTQECGCPTGADPQDGEGSSSSDASGSEGHQMSDLEAMQEEEPSPKARKAARKRKEREKKKKRKNEKGSEKKSKIRVDVLGNEEAFEQIADHLEVLARSQPNDKYILVTGLKNRGAVVAVTGDGTNDAPALKKADVGFAMGITGKEVAKQAADIVLMDDNFESIVKAVKWGRNIFDNIRKFLQFQLTVNVVAVSTAFIGSVVLRDSVLTSVQMLWVNLIMDTLGALALATEPPHDDLLKRKPHSRTEYLISKTMFRNIIFQAIYQLCVMFTMVFSGDCWLPEYEFYVSEENREKYPDYSEFSEKCGGGDTVRSGRRYFPFSDREDYKMVWTNNIGPSRHFTYVFNVFVFMQIFNLINARKIGEHEYGIFRGLLTNTTWVVIFLGITVGQVLLVEFGSFAVSCHPDGLTWQQWIISVLLGMGTLVVGLLVKFLPSRVIQSLPETGQKEVNVLSEPASLALASRGRISSGRISQRLVLTESGKVHPALSNHPLHGAYNRRRTLDPTIIQRVATSQPQLQETDKKLAIVVERSKLKKMTSAPQPGIAVVAEAEGEVMVTANKLERVGATLSPPPSPMG